MPALPVTADPGRGLSSVRERLAAVCGAQERGSAEEAQGGVRAGQVIDPGDDVGTPGAFPYTRGIHPTMYRGKLWTMRQYAGFGTPEETNARFRTLLAAGQTGLSVAF